MQTRLDRLRILFLSDATNAAISNPYPGIFDILEAFKVYIGQIVRTGNSILSTISDVTFVFRLYVK